MTRATGSQGQAWGECDTVGVGQCAGLLSA